MTTGKKEKSKTGSFLLFLFFVLIIAAGYFFFFTGKSESKKYIGGNDSVKLEERAKKAKDDFIKAVTDTSADSNEKIIILSSPIQGKIPYEIDENSSRPYKFVYTGKRINISVTGLDNRIGTRSNHADANHVISIMLDSAKIEIISIPRDTPADAGIENDTMGLNKLTIVRAARGRNSYQKELARIAGVDKIHYYVEGGFSQVMGILEFFGYKDSKSTLQVLRSRTGLGGDDYQRSYNQGQFMRQMMLTHFDKAKGFSGEVLIRGALTILETDLTTAVVKDIIDRLEAKGFPRNREDVVVKIRPPMYTKFKVYDFTDQDVVVSLKNKIENFNESYISDSTHSSPNVYKIIKRKLDKAALDSAKRPNNVINSLKIMFSQRVWLQIEDPKLRDSIRNEFGILLSGAYMKKNQTEQAKQVWYVINTERELMKNKIVN